MIEINKIYQESLTKAKILAEEKPLVAEMVINQFLKCFPDDLKGLKILYVIKNKLGVLQKTIEICERIIEIEPDDPDNFNNLGLTHFEYGNHEEAILNFEKAIKIDPNCYEFYNNISLQYAKINDFDKALKHAKRALEIEQNSHNWYNVGCIYASKNDTVSAKKAFEESIKIDKNHAGSHYSMSHINFLQDNWDTGFKEHEWRFNFSEQLKIYKEVYDSKKRWKGECLDGKTIILWGEQGFGDVIHYVRFVKHVKKYDCKIILNCPFALNELLSKCEGVDDTINYDLAINPEQHKDLPSHDYHCPLMSLPYVLKVYETQDNSYISNKNNDILDIIGFYPNTFNIGFSWQGNPVHLNDKTRSLNLEFFLPLQKESENVQLFSLQLPMKKKIYPNNKHVYEYEHGQGNNYQLEKHEIVDLSPHIKNFNDMAKLVADLDLVITIDSALLHLAGAMDITCWGLIAYNPDPRWGLTGEDTFWYRSVRLLRQPKYQDWNNVYKEIERSLAHEGIL